MDELAGWLAQPFLQRALLAGALVSILAGVLGVFVVLKGASFFGDAIAHASLAGVALGLLLDTQPLATALVVAVALTLLIHAVTRSGRVKLDTALGLVFSLGIALGVILLSLREGYQPELMSFLFGNILTVGWVDLGLMAVYTTVALAVIAAFRHRLLLVAVDPTAAHANGVNVGRLELLLQLLLTVTVVAGIRLLGVVLINALLVVPAGAARPFARSLGAMFVAAPIIGLGATVGGIALSVAWDLPSGPAIVVVACAAFLAALGADAARRRVRLPREPRAGA